MQYTVNSYILLYAVLIASHVCNLCRSRGHRQQNPGAAHTTGGLPQLSSSDEEDTTARDTSPGRGRAVSRKRVAWSETSPGSPSSKAHSTTHKSPSREAFVSMAQRIQQSGGSRSRSPLKDMYRKPVSPGRGSPRHTTVSIKPSLGSKSTRALAEVGISNKVMQVAALLRSKSPSSVGAAFVITKPTDTRNTAAAVQAKLSALTASYKQLRIKAGV